MAKLNDEIHIRVTSELKTNLIKLAKNERRSLSNLVLKTLEEAITNEF